MFNDAVVLQHEIMNFLVLNNGIFISLQASPLDLSFEASQPEVSELDNQSSLRGQAASIGVDRAT